MHILIGETRPCAYKRHGVVCGKPAIHLHPPNNEPRCTMYEIEAERDKREATYWRNRAEAISRHTGEPQAIDSWEPEYYAR